MRALLRGLLVACCPTAAAADAPDLITDRPDFTESAVSVPAAHVQLELGVEVADRDAGASLAAPFALVRWGLGAGVELRLGAPSLEIDWPEAGDTTTGVGAVEVGAKLELPLDLGVDIGVIPYVGVPLEETGSVGVTGGATLALGVDLSEHLSLGSNLGAAFIGLGGDDPDREYLASLALGVSLTREWGAFVEVFTVLVESDPDELPLFIDGGVTWLLTETFQLDVYAGIDARHAPDLFVGAGGAALF